MNILGNTGTPKDLKELLYNPSDHSVMWEYGVKIDPLKVFVIFDNPIPSGLLGSDVTSVIRRDYMTRDHSYDIDGCANNSGLNKHK